MCGAPGAGKLRVVGVCMMVHGVAYLGLGLALVCGLQRLVPPWVPALAENRSTDCGPCGARNTGLDVKGAQGLCFELGFRVWFGSRKGVQVCCPRVVAWRNFMWR